MTATPIQDVAKYTSGMQKSMMDKLFFLDKIDADRIIDFGCANGAMLGAISELFPDIHCIGYDISDEMLEIARKENPKASYTDNWSDIEYVVNEIELGRNALVLSSVIHEVYAYQREESVWDFWTKVFDSGFDYICIRDMMISDTAIRPTYWKDFVKVIGEANWGQILSFTSEAGSLQSNMNLIHFLLKYRYTENWDREVRENYLPFTVEHLLRRIIPPKYDVIYFDHYTLPFLQEQVKRDFDIELKDNTHVKLILKKRGK